MKTIKDAAVSGLFYPSSADALKSEVNAFLNQADSAQLAPPKALIAPHAGYVYSGSVAGSAFAAVKQLKGQIKRVLLFAPAHRVAVSGIALSSATHFATPLGEIPLAADIVEELSTRVGFEVDDQAFSQEHAIEVQLPFLQETLEEFELIPLLVGNVDPRFVSQILEEFWGGPETLIVISSDLSHYLDYKAAQEMDNEATQAIESLRPDRLTYHHACGRTAINGLLMIAKELGYKAHTVDLKNSGDSAGDKGRVVGYGAYHFNPG